MSVRQRVETRITQPLIPITLTRVAVAGGIVKSLGGSEEAVRIAQEGLAHRLLATVSVYGLDREGCVREKVEYVVDKNDGGEITLDARDGKSVLEALEPSLAKAVSFARRQFEAQGLKADVRFAYHDDIYADAERLAAARAKLGTVPGAPPPVASGYAEHQYLAVRPGKDKGSLVSMSTTRREP